MCVIQIPTTMLSDTRDLHLRLLSYSSPFLLSSLSLAQKFFFLYNLYIQTIYIYNHPPTPQPLILSHLTLLFHSVNRERPICIHIYLQYIMMRKTLLNQILGKWVCVLRSYCNSNGDLESGFCSDGVGFRYTG